MFKRKNSNKVMMKYARLMKTIMTIHNKSYDIYKTFCLVVYIIHNTKVTVFNV